MPPKRSSLWNHFEQIDDNNKGICNHCNQIISTRGGSVSNLLRHIRKKHTDIDVSVEGFLLKSDKVEDVIRSIFYRPPLWDKYDHHYGQEDVVESLWNEVAEETDISVQRLKTKWSELKNIYRKQLKMSEKTGKPKWIHFDTLNFLKPMYENENDFNDETAQQIVVTDMGSNSNDSYVNISPSKYAVLQDRQTELSTLREFLIPKRKAEFDEDMSFFHSLLPYIKKISSLKKLALRNEINSIVSKYICENEDPLTVSCKLDEDC